MQLLGPRSLSVVRHLKGTSQAIALGFAGSAPLALVVGGKTARVLDVATDTSVSLQTHGEILRWAVFDGRGNRVVALGGLIEDTARVWDTATGRVVGSMPSGSDPSISPDGRFLATTRSDSDGGLWSIDGHRQLATLGYDTRVAFSNDSRELAAVERDGDTLVVSTRRGRTTVTLPSFGAPFVGEVGTDWGGAATFSSDDRLVAVSNLDGLVRVWEIATGKQVAAIGAGWANALAFAPGRDLLAAMTWNGAVMVAHATESLRIQTGSGSDYGSPDFDPVVAVTGAYVVVPDARGAALWTMQGQRKQVLPTPSTRPKRDAVTRVAVSADGNVVAVTAGQPSCCSFGPGQKEWTAVWRVGSRSPFRPLPWALSGIALDADGSIATFGGKAWRTASGDPIPTLDGIIALSADARLALVRRDATAAIVDVKSGRTLTDLHGFGLLKAGSPPTAAFSPDDTRVLTLRPNGVPRLWNAATGALIAPLSRSALGQQVGFADEGRLAYVLFEAHAATFDAANGKPVNSFKGSFTAISADGRLVAAPGAAGEIHVADLVTNDEYAVPTDTAEALVSVAFVPGSNLIVVTDYDGDVHIVRCPVCAGDSAVLRLANTELDRLKGFVRLRPVVSTVIG